MLILKSTIFITAPPHFKLKPPDTVYVKVGEAVTLSCEAIGTPLPVISWSKVSYFETFFNNIYLNMFFLVRKYLIFLKYFLQDNLPLQVSSSIRISATELRIFNIQQSDIGDYLCVAANKEGKVNARTKVIVAGTGYRA